MFPPIFGISGVFLGPWLLVTKRHAAPWTPTPVPGMKSMPQSIDNILQIRLITIGISAGVLGWIWDRSLRGEAAELSGSNGGGHWWSAVDTTVDNPDGPPGIGAPSSGAGSGGNCS